MKFAAVAVSGLLAFTSNSCRQELARTNGDPLQVADVASLFPDMPNQKVTLKLANISIAAEMSMIKSGQKRELSISKSGSELERETYVVTADSIQVAELGTGETFEPPIPLISANAPVGAQKNWSGTIGYAQRRIPASAEIVSEPQQLDFATGPAETLHVTVRIDIRDNSPKPAQRKLEFWFAKDKGPLRRDYGNQIREPR